MTNERETVFVQEELRVRAKCWMQNQRLNNYPNNSSCDEVSEGFCENVQWWQEDHPGAGQPPQEVTVRARAAWPRWAWCLRRRLVGRGGGSWQVPRPGGGSICLSDTVMKREKELTISHRLLPYLPTPTYCSPGYSLPLPSSLHS